MILWICDMRDQTKSGTASEYSLLSSKNFLAHFLHLTQGKFLSPECSLGSLTIGGACRKDGKMQGKKLEVVTKLRQIQICC